MISSHDIEWMVPEVPPHKIERYYIQRQRNREYRKGEEIISWVDAYLDFNMNGQASLAMAKTILPKVEEFYNAPCRIVKRTVVVTTEVVE